MPRITNIKNKGLTEKSINRKRLVKSKRPNMTTKKSFFDRRLERKAKRQQLPNAKFKREQFSKAAGRAYVSSLVSQALTPLIEYISIAGDDNEKIRLAEIQRDIQQIQSNKELAETKTKLQILVDEINTRNKDESKQKSKDNVSSIIKTGIQLTDKGKVNRL